MKVFNVRRFLVFLLLLISFVTNAENSEKNSVENGIKPYAPNPWYWQYNGKPVLLVGASDDDNLFQWVGDKLTGQLNKLASVGGNYLRNTMSDREPGNVFTFNKTNDTLYNLNTWNSEYWERLIFFLDETSKRDIIVQLTLWDHFDISASIRWDKHPWNPRNNVNMENDTWQSGRDFYTTVNRNDAEGLKYQKQFIDKLLSVTLQYNNVIYNINNESDESPEWEKFWANYLKSKSKEAGKDVYVTTLQFDPSNAVRFVMSNPGLFDYFDISQNNQDSRGARGQAHWDNIMFWRAKIAQFQYGPMPMNNVKVYGGKEGLNFSAGSETEAINRLWRNIFAGCAASRFHRPAGDLAPWGSGLNERVLRHLKSMNMLMDELDIFSCTPHNDLLVSRVAVPTAHEAYVTANIGRQYAVFFPQGRYTVALDPWVYVDSVEVKWLDLENAEWTETEVVEVVWEGGHSDWGYRGRIALETPANRACVALIEIPGK